MKKILKIFFSIFISQILFIHCAHADISASISLNPKNPEPNSTISITLESYSFDVDTADITWEVRNKIVLEGEGRDVFTIRTGNVGEVIPITVTAKTASGDFIKQEINITPSSVSLLYEAPKSYVPTFYEGRSLPSEGGTIRVSALPQLSDNGVMLDPSRLAYSWYINDTIFKKASGIGKQSINVRLDYLHDTNEIKVVARTPLGNIATKTITVYAHPVLPLLYNYDPILGSDFTMLINKRYEAIKNFTLSLEPLYVSIGESKEPTYTWYLNGLPATPIGGRVLELHPKENDYGSKILTLDVFGPDRRLQSASNRIEIIFDTRKP